MRHQCLLALRVSQPPSLCREPWASGLGATAFGQLCSLCILGEPLVAHHTPAYSRTALSPPQAHGVTAPPLGLVPLSHRGPKESEGRVVASLDREQDTFVGERNGRPGPSACRPAGSPWDPAGQEGRRWPGLRSDFLFHGSSPPARCRMRMTGQQAFLWGISSS